MTDARIPRRPEPSPRTRLPSAPPTRSRRRPRRSPSSRCASTATTRRLKPTSSRSRPSRSARRSPTATWPCHRAPARVVALRGRRGSRAVALDRRPVAGRRHHRRPRAGGRDARPADRRGAVAVPAAARQHDVPAHPRLRGRLRPDLRRPRVVRRSAGLAQPVVTAGELGRHAPCRGGTREGVRHWSSRVVRCASASLSQREHPYYGMDERRVDVQATVRTRREGRVGRRDGRMERRRVRRARRALHDRWARGRDRHAHRSDVPAQRDLRARAGAVADVRRRRRLRGRRSTRAAQRRRRAGLRALHRIECRRRQRAGTRPRTRRCRRT